jgi:phasin
MNIEAAPEGVESVSAAAKPEVEIKPAKAMIEGFEAFPETVRAAAEKIVTQSRDAYEKSKDAMEETVEMLEQSIDKAGQGTAAINRKVIEATQSNLNSGFELAKDLAGAKNVAEIFQLQSAFARKQLEAFTTQVTELRELSTKVATDSAEPLKAHMERSMKSLKLH